MAKIVILEIPDDEIPQFEASLPSNAIKDEGSLSMSKARAILRGYLMEIDGINESMRQKRGKINRLKAESQQLAEETRVLWEQIETAA